MRRTLDPIFYADTAEQARQAIKKGANVNALNGKWKSAIYYATVDNDYELVEVLLENGANPNDATGGLSIATLASENGNLNLVQLLFKYGANINHGCLYSAAEHGHVDIVNFLIEHGADVNQESISYPIIGAIRAKNNDIVILLKLIMACANIDVIDIYGNNPLSMAAYLGKLEIIDILISQGADIHTNEYRTLWNALGEGHPEVFNFLIDSGYDINIKNKKGQTLIDEAANNMMMDTVIALIEKGANLSQVNESNSWFIEKALKFINNKNEGIDEWIYY